MYTLENLESKAAVGNVVHSVGYEAANTATNTSVPKTGIKKELSQSGNSLDIFYVFLYF